MPTIPEPTSATPTTGRRRRAQKLLTEAVTAIAAYKPTTADDIDLSQAIYAIDRAKMIIGKRIDMDTPDDRPGR